MKDGKLARKAFERDRLYLWIGAAVGIGAAVASILNPSIAVWTGLGSFVTVFISAVILYVAIPLTAAFVTAGLVLMELRRVALGHDREKHD